MKRMKIELERCGTCSRNIMLKGRKSPCCKLDKRSNSSPDGWCSDYRKARHER